MDREWEKTVRRADVEALRRLLAAGADIDARDQHGQTALMIAAHEGSTRIVSVLVEHGAMLDHTAKHGLSALMLAVIGGSPEIVRILVHAGADLTIRGTGALGFSGKTALDLATMQGRSDIVDIIGGRT
jgi:ankyrin repeat protein